MVSLEVIQAELDIAKGIRKVQEEREQAVDLRSGRKEMGQSKN